MTNNLSLLFCVNFYFLAVSSPLSSEGFVSTNRLSASQRKFRSSRRHVLQNPDLSSTTKQNDTEENNKWWEEVTFEHGDVAETTRPDFEILMSTTIGDSNKQLIYLDSGATSQTPKQVIQDTQNYYEKLNSNVHRGAHTLSRKATEAFEDGRDAVASFINANSRNEVVFTSGATEAINLVASSYSKAI
jgi:DNA-binding transcriptional MocR family regulator